MNESLIPQKYRILSGSALKVIALVSMLIDHTAAVLLGNSSVILLRIGARSLSLYLAMRLIGRLAFPIYAYLLTEGFSHTRSRRNYGIRLFLFALLSELPWNLEHTGTFRYPSQNVFFTLFLGYLGLCVIERLETQNGSRLRNTLYLLLLLVVSRYFRADYGCRGFGFILILYLLRRRTLYQAVAACCFLSGYLAEGPAFIPLSLYNGKRGFIRDRVQSLFFYALYPLHMLILYGIRLETIGY